MERFSVKIILAITALFILYTIPITFMDLLPSGGVIYAIAVPSVWALALWILWKKYKMDKDSKSVSKGKRIIINILAVLIVSWVGVSLFAALIFVGMR